MRFLCRWFCRLIGVGSALDMVNIYLMTLLWIYFVFVIIIPDDVDGKKHRSSHRHAPHRHHNHHRKHPTGYSPRFPSNKNNSVVTKTTAERSIENFRTTKIINGTPWIFHQTSDALFYNGTHVGNEDITNYRRNDNSFNVTSIPTSGRVSSNDDRNSSETENFARQNNHSNGSNDLFDVDDRANASINVVRNIGTGLKITIGFIEESTTRIFANSYENSSPSRQSEDVGINDGDGLIISDVSVDNGKIGENGIVKGLEKLFGPSENEEKSSTDGYPFVELIRKKRSSPTETDENDVAATNETKKPTLLDLRGPSITNDAEEIDDRRSVDGVRVRVKRDGSELDDERSALASFDSTYLRNLEDSFALSALEIRARESKLPESFRREKRHRRENPDLSVDGTRIKRESRLNVREYDTDNDLVEPIKSSPVDYVSGNDGNDPTINVNERESYSSSGSTGNSSEGENVDKIGNGVNGFDRAGRKNVSSLDSRRAVDALSAGGRSTTPDDSIETNLNSVSRNSVNDVDRPTDNFSTVNANPQNRTIFFTDRSQPFTPEIGSSKDVNANIKSLGNGVKNEERLSYGSSTPDTDRGKISDYFPAVSEASPIVHPLDNKVDSRERNGINVNDGPVVDRNALTSISVNDSAAESSAPTLSDLFVNNAYGISYNGINDTEHSVDNSSTTSGEYLSRLVNSASENRINDIQHRYDTDNSSYMDVNMEETRRNNDTGNDASRMNDAAAHPVIQERSSTDKSVLKDERSISRYGLDDVYPDTIQDPEDPSSLVQLVRTKRFGDVIAAPEVAEASYSNGADVVGMANEPYAEDDRIIDSMLSKVDYRSIDEQNESSASNDNERPSNEAEIFAVGTGDDVTMRGKRGTFRKRKGKKTKKKKHKKKKKKTHKDRAQHRRSESLKIKRASSDSSRKKCELDDSPSDPKSDDDEGLYNGYGERIAPSWDGKRRRESGNEDDDYFYGDNTGKAGRVRREIPETDSNEENVARNSAGGINGKPEMNVRDKRNSGVRDVNASKKSREARIDRNGKGKIAEKRSFKTEAVESIHDIRQLVATLLSKVDGLNNYMAENGEDVTQRKESHVPGMLHNASNPDEFMEVPPEVLQQIEKSRSAENDAPKPADAIKQSAPCWKHPTVVKIETPAPKNNRPARYLRGQQCGKNPRRKRKSHRKWDRWTDWSSCSVTCGRGRQIRWRHCIRNCSTAETEMEEKACQLPACAPGKFLGIFG